ncbi:MAG: aspartate aminotransferase family protein [Gammaproteobacteria bacterium]|nr:MAG: aspartate aminotransferase family protein [Gammaproteobacteria bacterium]
MNTANSASEDPRTREAAVMLQVYGQLPFVPAQATGCDLVTTSGQRILDFWGGHAVAALGHGHPRLVQAICEQARQLIFQSNAVALDVRAAAAEQLVGIAPKNLSRVFFVNSGAEANENALRMACLATGRQKILALTHGFHGRTAAAGAVTWNSADSWYGFPNTPFAVDFIPRNDVAAAESMIDESVAAVIFEPVQGVAGAFDLSADFVAALREGTSRTGALLISDEVQCGMGRSGHYFAIEACRAEPDLLTTAKGLGGGIPCGALLCSESVSKTVGLGSLGSTFGGGPVAAAAIIAVIETIKAEDLLANVRRREAEIREHCVTGPVRSVQGMGLLLGLVCDRPAGEIRDALLQRDILTGTSADPSVLRLLPPLVLQPEHVRRLAKALGAIAPKT